MEHRERTPVIHAAPQPMTTDRLGLGEGARWCGDGDVVHLVDLDAGLLYTTTTPWGGLDLVLQVATTLGGAARIKGRPDTWLLAAGRQVVTADNGALTVVAELPPDSSVPTRFNDATSDPAGRLWLTSMPVRGDDPVGALHRLEPPGSLVTAMTGLGIGNGPAFNATGELMYVADTGKRRILRCVLNPVTAELRQTATHIQFDPTGPAPDGMTVDGKGFLWVAMWGGSCIHRIRPDGELDVTIHLPARQPTSVCLVPSATGSTLVITTATAGLVDPGGMDGAVMVLSVAATAIATPSVTWP